MNLREIRDTLGCEVIAGEEQLEMEVGVGCGSDLMSDVLAFIKPDALLLTGLNNAQVVRTADIADVRAIVFVRGKRPDRETIELAKEKGIPLLTTNLLMYESCGRLYAKGLRGGSEQQSGDKA
jgi:predicted transcriptional regulator